MAIRKNPDGSEDTLNSKGEVVAHRTAEEVKQLADDSYLDNGYYDDGKGGLEKKPKPKQKPTKKRSRNYIAETLRSNSERYDREHDKK